MGHDESGTKQKVHSTKCLPKKIGISFYNPSKTNKKILLVKPFQKKVEPLRT